MSDVPAEPARHWQHLPLGGDDRERFLRGLAAIVATLVGRTHHDPSLATGEAGAALLFAYLAEAEGSEERAEQAVRLAEEAMAAAVSGPTGAGLYSGLFGPAWVLAHLDGWLLDLSAGDPNDAVDRAVLDLLHTRPWRQSYDLIDGLVGIGVYALERLPRLDAARALEMIVAHLAAIAVDDAGGITWHTAAGLLPDHQRMSAPSGYFNLGVAHGVPGVIALLAATARAGVAVDDALRLLDGAVRWVLTQQLPSGGFASWVAPGVTARRSRTAWCYGELGIAAALLVAAMTSGRDEWRAAAVDIATGTTERRQAESRVEDAGVCHGAAGVAHIYHRFWQQTQDERFARAARHWLTRTLDLLPATTASGFLEGRAGVALVLLGATGTEPMWDRILLLSAKVGA